MLFVSRQTLLVDSWNQKVTTNNNLLGIQIEARDREILGSLRTGNVEIGTGLHPVTTVSVTSRVFRAVGGATHILFAENFASHLKIAAIETVVHAENQVGLEVSNDLRVVAAAQSHPRTIQVAQSFDQQVVRVMKPRGMLLNEIVEIDSETSQARRIFQHAFDTHFHFPTIDFPHPSTESDCSRIVTSTCTRC